MFKSISITTQSWFPPETTKVWTEEGRLHYSKVSQKRGIPIEITDSISSMSAEAFSDSLEEIHMERWKKVYENLYIEDGESWEVEYIAGDDTIRRYRGYSSFPKTYNRLVRLIQSATEDSDGE